MKGLLLLRVPVLAARPIYLWAGLVRQRLGSGIPRKNPLSMWVAKKYHSPKHMQFFYFPYFPSNEIEHEPNTTEITDGYTHLMMALPNGR